MTQLDSGIDEGIHVEEAREAFEKNQFVNWVGGGNNNA